MPAHSGGESITISQFLRSSVFHTVVKVNQVLMMKGPHACQKREGKNAKSNGQLGPKKKWPLFFAVAHELDQWGTGSELARVVLVPLYHLRTFARRWEQ